MSKMMGKNGEGAALSAATKQEKLTLAEMGGYDMMHQQGRYDAVAGGGERRTRRR
jgi:hypothetical protein